MNDKIKDTAMFLFGLFLLGWSTVQEETPQPIVIGAGLLLIAGAPVLNAFLRQRKEGND